VNNARFYKGTLSDAHAFAFKQYDCWVIFVSQHYKPDTIADGCFAATYNLDVSQEVWDAQIEAHKVRLTISLIQDHDLPHALDRLKSAVAYTPEQTYVIFTDSLELAKQVNAQYVPSSYLRK